MKTSEEILEDKLKSSRSKYFRTLPFIYREAVLDAMEEYRKQGGFYTEAEIAKMKQQSFEDGQAMQQNGYC